VSEVTLIEDKVNSPPILLGESRASNGKTAGVDIRSDGVFALAGMRPILTGLPRRGMVAAIFLDHQGKMTRSRFRNL